MGWNCFGNKETLMGKVRDMFGSALLTEAVISDAGRYDPDHPLMKTCYAFYLDVVERNMMFSENMSDKEFENYFADDFPPGFIKREKNRARQVVDDLHAIAKSEVIRYELDPIYTYVMYHFILDWFECYMDNQAEEGRKRAERYLPDIVQEYLKSREISPRIKRLIREWTTDADVCRGDFQNTYNGDYTSTDFAERIAAFYLNDDSFMLQMLGVKIQEFFDLLPNDLRDKCIRKYYGKQNSKMSKELYPTQIPCVFLSYSWDTKQHKKWVEKLAEQLEQDGVRVILDQKDLSPGDPMTLFMEKSIEHSDYVLFICTPGYKQKADARVGGVGYEESIITSDVLLNQNHRKYIPILASGSWEISLPVWARGKYGVDLSRWPADTTGYMQILNTLKSDVFVKSGRE